MIRWKQANMGFKDWGLTYGNPDFVKYAESYGASGYCVESAAHLTELLAQTRDTPGVHLIDCPVVYSENDQILNRSEEHTSELQSLMRISYAVFCLKKKKIHEITN